ncbi:Gfo/Idh/MocA family protein [Reichenbachiella ulvae]|uniref:Gfo/Idh/MocA family oxidoreductase n=1 Tax=Reichenbachiella ulvae TaxID=2980104 RepID=A0ABT3CNQ3_9BACT|nr:Gfo/Idh/MocA family oxidoreductase [Reichenbachiella ulvae]MCV9385272.1 Gfo/Idh/MocA family oxidoreductase [Reichenbachiella ulvae]
MERRNFIKQATKVTAGLGAGLSLVSCSQSNGSKKMVAPWPDDQRIRIGIIGVGNRGSSIVDVLNASPIFKVIACCDVLSFRLNDAMKRINDEAKGYRDYEDLLKNDELEAVVISTPLHEHYRIAMDALDADLHIMCEKALAHDIEQSQNIKRKADQSNKLFQISYQYQLNPTFKAIKDIIHSGHCGKVMRIDACWHRNSNWRRPVENPALERQINWRMYREYSGGLMAELGSHHLNMIDNIMGTHPVKVVGSGGIDYWKDGREVFDNVYTIFDYPNGAKASFSSILSNKYEDQTIKFYGDKATIVTNQMNEAYIYPEGESASGWGEGIDGVSGASIKLVDDDQVQGRKITPREEVNNCPFEDNYMKTTWLLYDNFAAAIKGEKELLVGLEDGYQSAISVHMANMAMREERTVKWLPEYDI